MFAWSVLGFDLVLDLLVPRNAARRMRNFVHSGVWFVVEHMDTA